LILEGKARGPLSVGVFAHRAGHANVTGVHRTFVCRVFDWMATTRMQGNGDVRRTRFPVGLFLHTRPGSVKIH
jgi:hypothetical protein